MEGCLDRGAPAFREACGGEVVLDLLLPEGRVRAVHLLSHWIQQSPVQHGETFFSDCGQGTTAGLDPKFVRCLERGISASGDYILVVATILARHFNQFLDLRHNLICLRFS